METYFKMGCPLSQFFEWLPDRAFTLPACIEHVIKVKDVPLLF